MNLNPTSGGPPLVDDLLVPYVDALQRRTGLSRSTAERMAARGDINVVRIGRRVLVKESELRRLIDGAVARSSGAVQ